MIGQILTKPYTMTALSPLGSSDWMERIFINLIFLGLELSCGLQVSFAKNYLVL